MKSVMVHQFSQVPRAEIPRSVFNRSHGLKTTFDGGYLVPIFVDEALPGDTFSCRATLFGRLSTPIVPIMDNLFLDTFYFAVPFRLVWSNFQRFCGEREDPDQDNSALRTPVLQAPVMGGWVQGSLADYFGLPLGASGLEVSALYFRAYNLIWNEWFRDQNSQDPLVVNKADSGENNTNYALRRRNKKHDYFTSALPWPQKGDAVDLPLGGSAPVIGTGNSIRWSTGNTHLGFITNNGGVINGDTTSGNQLLPSIGDINNTIAIDYSRIGLTIVPGTSGMIADLSSATAATINSLRQAFQIQRLLERDARGGTRYTELVRAHFGVISPDARLQRPEYLGGSSARLNIQQVTQTSATGIGDDTTPQGNLAAYGVMSDSAYWTKSFTEHTIIIGLAQVRADITYCEGVNRMWSRSTRYDYYWPALAMLGEQDIKIKEIYCAGSNNEDWNNPFGYQERWAEYRYKPSMITGKFRLGYGYDIWHLCQPQNNSGSEGLSDLFLEDHTDLVLARVLAVEDEPQILLDGYFDLKCARPMPVYGVPGLIDHF